MAIIEQLYSGNDYMNRVAKLRIIWSNHTSKLRKRPVNISQPIQSPNTEPNPYQQHLPIHHKFPILTSPRSQFFTSRFHASYSKAMKMRVHIPVMILHRLKLIFEILTLFTRKSKFYIFLSLSEKQELMKQNSSRFQLAGYGYVHSM